MKLRASNLISALLMLGAAASANATTLLDLVNPAVQQDTQYSLSFTATNSLTTLSVAGYQVPSGEYASQNGVFLNGNASNLLGQTWNFVPAAQGSDAAQYFDGTSVNELVFAGVSAGYFDTYSQTFATTIGSTYTYNFLFSEEYTGPSAFVVTTDAANVPEPASLALLGFGLAGLSMSRRRNKQQ